MEQSNPALSTLIEKLIMIKKEKMMLMSFTKKEISIFIISLIGFILSVFGLFDGATESIYSFLYSNLGYTETKGTAFGPIWFYNTNVNISAIFGREAYILFGVFFIIHYIIIKNYFDLTWFSFTFIGAFFFVLFFKFLYQDIVPTKFLHTSITQGILFPSGHAFLSVIMSFLFYWEIIKKGRSKAYRNFIGSFMIFLISINSLSRIFLNRHSVDDIIGGWSLATIWLIFSIFINKMMQKSLNK